MAGIWGYDWKLRLIIITQNIVIISIFVGGGWLIDAQLNTKPLCIVIGLLLSFVVNQMISIKIIRWYIKGKPVYDPTEQENTSTNQTHNV